jgi:hypothetical protein
MCIRDRINSVDINTVGDYTIIYSVTDSIGNTTTEEMTLTIVENLVPVFANLPTFVVYQSQTYDLLAEITASDDVDGDITASIQVSDDIDMDTPGTYTVTYTVTDSYNQTTTETVNFVVVADEAPVILGTTDFSVEQGGTYDLLDGVTASDDVDGDLSLSIQVDDTVDVNTPSMYIVTYTVTDSYGNTTTETITVTVTALTSPYSGDVLAATATEPYVIEVIFEVDMLDNMTADTAAFTVVVDGVTALVTDVTIGSVSYTHLTLPTTPYV